MHHPRGLWCQCTMIKNSVIPAYSGTAMELFFPLCKQVQFNTGNFNLYPRGRRRLQLKTGLRYAQVPFKTGFLVQRLLTYKSCAFKRFPVKFL